MRRLSYSEIALLATFVFMILGIIYSWNQNSKLEESMLELQKMESEIIQTLNYKKSWETKGVDKKIRRLKTILPSYVIKDYKIGHKKAYLKLSQMEAKVINRFLVKLSSLPVQFITLNIDGVGEKYNMECRCRW